MKKTPKEGGQVEEKLRELLQHSMKGDQASYEAFLVMASAVIRRYLSSLSKGQIDIHTLEDLEQEILMSLHQKKHTYTWDRPLLPWLHAIVRYRYIDLYRQKKRSGFHVELDENLVGEEESPVVHEWDEVLGMLTPKQRQMFTLIKVEGQSYAEAAAQLNMSVSAVKVSVHRLVKSLKDKVQK